MVHHNPIVFDVGSSLIRCGFAPDEEPRISIPNVAKVHNPLSPSNLAYVEPLRPMIDGKIVYSSKLHFLLNYCLNSVFKSKLGHRTSESSIISNDNYDTLRDCSSVFTLSSYQPSFHPQLKSNLAFSYTNLLEWAFEDIQLKRCQLLSSALMALYAAGGQTGMVIDMGYESTRITSILSDGETDLHQQQHHSRIIPTTLKHKYGGRHLTEALRKHLELRCRHYCPPSILSKADNAIEQIKHHCCFVSNDFMRDQRLCDETSFYCQQWELPDGTFISYDRARFEVPELLFNNDTVGNSVYEVDCPSFLCYQGDNSNRDDTTLQSVIGDAFIELPLDLRRTILESFIVLCGGNSMILGLPLRLENEIKQIYATRVLARSNAVSTIQTRLVGHPHRDILQYRGAAIWANMISSCDDYWITRSDFEEEGTARIFLPKSAQPQSSTSTALTTISTSR